MNVHESILRRLHEDKGVDKKSKLAEAIKLLKEVAGDVEAQERMDLMTAIMDIEDVGARI